MADSPELSGLLYKRRGGFGKIMPNAWQYRFFTISKDGILQYFDTEIPDTDSLDSRARGRLDLKAVNYEVSVEPIEGAPTQYSIQIIVPSEETWKMCAYGKEDQQRWIKAIEKHQHEKLSKSANVVASYTSDDDGERMKRSATKSLRENSSAGTIVADPSTKSDLVASPRSSTVSNVVKQNVATENVNPPQAPKLQRRGSMNKRRLKLAGSKGIVNQELGELLLVIAILNICIVGIVHSGSFFRKILYWVVANFVIAHTLSLRSERSKRVSRDHTAQIPSNSHISGSQSPTSKVEDIPVVIEAETIPIEGTETVEAEKLVAITGQKPVPGQTYSKTEGDPRRAPPHTWSVVDYRLFNVRIGPNYDRYKKKAPSGPPIYEPFAVDVFCTKSRVDHAATRFQLPDCTGLDTNNKFVPPLFVIQIQIPSEPPPSFFSTVEDGPGWAVVMYFRITENACAQLKDLATASPAVKLFAQWCEKAETDPTWRGRFKVINSCTNLSEIGVPSAIEAYNAKPVLIRRTGSIFRGENHMEMNIHVHKFANLAKQSIYLLSSRCAQLYMQIGFVIEGRDDSELPETVFACVAINRPQEDQAEFIFDDQQQFFLQFSLFCVTGVNFNFQFLLSYMMSYDDIQRFRNLTGLENIEEINYWLESGNSLDNALELYFGSLNVKDSISSQAIRKPDQAKRARLISEVDDIRERGKKRRKEETVAFRGPLNRPSLGALYAIPLDISTSESFDAVKDRARQFNQWLLVNIQSEREFACHELNRDFWSNESIKELIKCSFVFWQQLSISEEGMKYIRCYKVQNFPYVAILHPATGAAIWSREMVSASLLFEKIQDFIGQYPSPDLYGQERRGLEPEEKFADKVMTSSISLPMPLSSFSFIPSQILLKENSNPRPFREIRGGMRLKIKMPNGHVFLRIFSADDCLMVLVLEIIDQISQQDHSKPFDILYDHPQKSLSARAFLGSSELINDFLNSTSFRAVGITFDQVVLVRFSDD